MNLEEIKARKKEILERSKTAAGAELAKLTEEMADLNNKENEIRSEQADAEKRAELAAMIDAGEAETSPIEKRGIRSIMNKDLEYRKAFMEYFLHGTPIPAELRSAPLTSTPSVTGDLASVIPATTMNTIVQEMKNFGNLLPLVKKVNYPAGLVIPTSQLVDTASWGVAEGGEIKYGKKATSHISFAANKLSAALGISFEARIESLDVFEAALASDIATSMTMALEKAIVSGTGTGQPTGITTYKTSANSVEYKGTYKSLIEILKKMPSQYAAGAVLTMNANTFYDIYGMVDSAGQPIARINQGISAAPTYSLLGRQVVLTDYLPSIDTAAPGEVIGYFFNYDRYILNTAYAMDLVSYIENSTRNKVYQSVGMYDGKIVDSNGLVFIVKEAAGSSNE